MKLTKVLLPVVLSTVVMGTSAFAADASAPAPTNICVVQVANVLHNAPKVQKETEGLKKQFEADQKKLEADQKSLQTKMANFDKEKAVMSKKDKDKAQAEITKSREDLVGRMGAFQQSLSDAQNKVMKEVFDSLNTTMQTVAKDKHCDVVLDSQFVVYATPSHDVTADVQKAFDSQK